MKKEERRRKKTHNLYLCQYVPTLKVTDSFQDTNTVAYSHPSVVDRVIVEVLDVIAFVVAYDHPSVVVFDPMVLE